jgi:hypothetical protein
VESEGIAMIDDKLAGRTCEGLGTVSNCVRFESTESKEKSWKINNNKLVAIINHSITASQHHSITASQHHSITASQHHSFTASQHHSFTASQHHSITASQLHSITASQHHSFTASQHHSFTASQLHSLSLALLLLPSKRCNCITVAVATRVLSSSTSVDRGTSTQSRVSTI